MTEIEIKNELAALSDQGRFLQARLAHAEGDEVKALLAELKEGHLRKAALREELDGLMRADQHLERELLPKVALANYIKAVADGDPLRGAEAELDAEEVKDGPRPHGGTWIPHKALAGRDRKIQAADAFGSAPTADTGGRITWVERVFADTAAVHLRVQMDSVPPGTKEYAVINASNEDAALVSRGSVHDSSGLSLSIESLTPTRLSAAYGFGQEDLMRMGPEMEAAIRRDLTGAIGERLDAEILNGNGTAPNLGGLQNEGSAPSGDFANGTAVDSWENAVQKLAGLALDGRHATDTMHARSVVGTRTASYLVGLVRAGNHADTSAWWFLNEVTGGVRVSALAKAATTNNKIQEAIVARTGGSGPNAVCAHWGGGIQAIRDEASADMASRGRVKIHFNSYVAFAVLRSAAFYRTSHRFATGS